MKSASPEAPVTIRAATAEDFAGIARIQSASPESAQWEPGDYECLVAFLHGELAGFLVFRKIAVTELEVLNLAVDLRFRRQGMARQMMQFMLSGHRGDVFLEVRESNLAARKFYESIGFQEIGHRRDYYKNPVESGIVMKFLSC
jgi:ribosomal protein S18 acetylase RimI-like enzyme